MMMTICVTVGIELKCKVKNDFANIDWTDGYCKHDQSCVKMEAKVDGMYTYILLGNDYHHHKFHLSNILTARRSYASAALEVIILPVSLSVCLSATRVLCDKTKHHCYGYYCPCTYEFSTVAARKWLVPVFAIQSTLFICVR